MRDGRRGSAVLVALAWAVVGCTGDRDASTEASGSPSAAARPAPAVEARAVLSPLGASGTAGTVRFGDARGASVEVRIDLTGAPPGEHVVGLLSEDQCPTGSGDGSVAPHRLTTVAVGQDGRVSTLLSSDAVSLERGAPGYVRGRPVVVGPPGAPVACGMTVAVGRWSES